MSRKEIQEHVSDCHTNRLKPIMEKLDKLDEKVDSIDVKLASLPKDLADEFDKRYAEKGKVEDLQDSIKWVTRLIIGAVILGILALVIKS